MSIYQTKKDISKLMPREFYFFGSGAEHKVNIKYIKPKNYDNLSKPNPACESSVSSGVFFIQKVDCHASPSSLIVSLSDHLRV